MKGKNIKVLFCLLVSFVLLFNIKINAKNEDYSKISFNTLDYIKSIVKDSLISKDTTIIKLVLTPYSSLNKIKKISPLDIKKIEILPQKTRKYLSVKLLLKNKKFVFFKFEIEKYKKVPVLKKIVQKGEKISSDIIIEKVINISNYNAQDIIYDKNKLIGKIADVALIDNTPIRESQIKTPPLVKSGETIKVIFNYSKYVTITFTTKALNSGKLRDKILYKNPFNKKLEYGIIIGKGKVKKL